MTGVGPDSGDVRTLDIGLVTTVLPLGTFGIEEYAIQLEGKKDLTDLPRILPSPTFNCGSNSEIPLVECEALVSFYDSTNGPGWARQDGWLSTNTPCSWYGVTCEAGHVQQLDLYDNQLSGTLPPELGNLASLQTLLLGVAEAIPINPAVHYNAIETGGLANGHSFRTLTNQLGGAIPPQLGNLTSLRFLCLSMNRFEGAIPPQLGNLVNLTSLTLDGNRLIGAIPPELGNLANLQWLDLSHNQLSDAIPPDMGNLGKLEMLVMSDNQLSGGIPPELGNLASLIGLVLNGNQLSGSIPPELGSLGSLSFLELHENQFSGSLPPELGNLANLSSLYLKNNQFSGALPRSLMKLNLSWFYYNNTNLCEPADAAFQAWLAGISTVGRSGLICPNLYIPLCFR